MPPLPLPPASGNYHSVVSYYGLNLFFFKDGLHSLKEYFQLVALDVQTDP